VPSSAVRRQTMLAGLKLPPGGASKRGCRGCICRFANEFER
jgi:hypothetical protein